MTRTAIVSAMREELHTLLHALDDARVVRLAGRKFHVGEMRGRPVVLVLSGIGKVAVATTATMLMHEFDVTELVFTGVAGALSAAVRVGDVVVARQLIQHDMDASPLFPRFEVPLTGRSRFEADAQLSDALCAAALRCLNHAGELLGEVHCANFGIDSPLLHEGLVASGDRFVSGAAESAALRALLPDALAVEMEGAALAQVCADFGRPFAVLRTISDRADDSAHVDFTRFVHDVASVYTRAIIGDWLTAPRAA
jgi:adenosylhomocysteine nucleosidase